MLRKTVVRTDEKCFEERSSRGGRDVRWSPSRMLVEVRTWTDQMRRGSRRWLPRVKKNERPDL